MGQNRGTGVKQNKFWVQNSVDCAAAPCGGLWYSMISPGLQSSACSGWWEASHSLPERSIKERIAVNTKEDNAGLLLLQMQKGFRDLLDAHQQVRLSEEAVAQADENLKVNQDSYVNGLSALSDLLEAQALQQQVHDQLIDARAGYRKSLVAYLQMTGR